MNIPCYQLSGIAQKMGLSLEQILLHCQTLKARLYFKVAPELAVVIVDGRQLEPPPIDGGFVLSTNSTPIEHRPDVHFLALRREVCTNIGAQTELHISSSDYALSGANKVFASWSDHISTVSRYISIRAEPTFALLPYGEAAVLGLGVNFLKALPRTGTAQVEVKDLYLTSETFAGIKARVEKSREEGRFNMTRREGVFSEKLFQIYLAFERFWTNVSAEDLPSKADWRKEVHRHLMSQAQMSKDLATAAVSLICPSDEDFQIARETNKPKNIGFPPSAFMIVHDTALQTWDHSPNAQQKNEDLQSALKENGLYSGYLAKNAAAILNVAPRRGRPIQKPIDKLTKKYPRLDTQVSKARGD